MKHLNPKHETWRGDRLGLSSVEFSLLLPFFALAAATILSAAHLFYRSVCESHAAFAAARRCAVSGAVHQAFGYVRRDYRACAMPETPVVSAAFLPGEPGLCRVRIEDRLPLMKPGRRNRLQIRFESGATITATAAGRCESWGGDND